MNALRPLRWKSIALKLAGVLVVWMVVVAVFAAQFYWLGVDWPLRISWADAFRRAVTEWGPWLFLAPPTLWLAERFRLARGKWLAALLPHLGACVLVALAYQGLSQSVGLAGWTRIEVRTERGVAGLVIGNGPPPAGMMPDPEHLPQSSAVVGDFAGVIPAGPLPGGSFPPPPPGASIPGGDIPAELLPPGGFNAPILGGRIDPPPAWLDFLRTAAIRAQYSVPIYWTIVGLVWVAGYHRQMGERERHTLELESRLTQANLQALKSQLQPHFLFNTLNAIASLVRRQPEAAENMIVTLSDFLRHNLDASKEHEVPLRREIETLDLYLEIQQMRFGERLRVVKAISPETCQAIVPALLLQPLVENSVRHGIEPRASGGTITIRAKRDGGTLKMEVSDDGIGFKNAGAEAQREGIGLANTRARLLALYGGDQRFEISANPDGGIAIRMEIPWCEHPAAPATI